MRKKKRKKKEYDYFFEELYEFVDKVIGTLNRRYIGFFNYLKNIDLTNDKEVVREVTEIYKKLDRITRSYLLLLAKKIYHEIVRRYDYEEEAIEEAWLLLILEGYDPVTKYVYTHEVDRKRARLIEAIIASDNKQQEIENSKRVWSRQARQYADNVTRLAVEKAYKDNKVEMVRWLTELDQRVCEDCDDLHGKIFKIDEVPDPPHYGCRCYIEPYEEKK